MFSVFFNFLSVFFLLKGPGRKKEKLKIFVFFVFFFLSGGGSGAFPDPGFPVPRRLKNRKKLTEKPCYPISFFSVSSPRPFQLKKQKKKTAQKSRKKNTGSRKPPD